MSQTERRWIADGAINNDKMDHTDTYDIGGLNNYGNMWTAGDASVVSGLTVDGTATFNSGVSFATDSSLVGNLYVSGTVGVGITNQTSSRVMVRTYHDSGIELNDHDLNATRLIMAMDASNHKWNIKATHSNAGNTYPITFLMDTTEIARMQTSGDVGIGTTNPGSMFEVSNETSGRHAEVRVFKETGSSSDRASLKVGYNDSACLEVYREQGTAKINVVSKGSGEGIYFATNSANFMFNGGYVGIGTTTPSVDLDINNASPIVYVTATAGTNQAYQEFQNTGGSLRVGLDSNAGGSLLTSSLSYAGILNRVGNYPIQFGTNNQVRMTISGSGPVGIGTDAPSPAGAGKLHLYTGSATGAPVYSHADHLVVEHNGNAGASFLSSDTGSGTIMFASPGGVGGHVVWDFDAESGSGLMTLSSLKSGSNLALGASGSESVRVTSTGVGIGVTNPTQRLDVNGKITLRGGDALNYLESYGNTHLTLNTGGSSGALIFKTNGNERARIHSNGYLGIGMTPVFPLDVTGSVRISSIPAAGSASVYLTHSSGVIQSRTTSQLLSDINGESYIAPGTTAQYWRGDKTWQNLTTATVPESGNLYFTNTRARSAVGISSNNYFPMSNGTTYVDSILYRDGNQSLHVDPTTSDWGKIILHTSSLTGVIEFTSAGNLNLWASGTGAAGLLNTRGECYVNSNGDFLIQQKQTNGWGKVITKAQTGEEGFVSTSPGGNTNLTAPSTSAAGLVNSSGNFYLDSLGQVQLDTNSGWSVLKLHTGGYTGRVEQTTSGTLNLTAGGTNSAGLVNSAGSCYINSAGEFTVDPISNWGKLNLVTGSHTGSVVCESTGNLNLVKTNTAAVGVINSAGDCYINSSGQWVVEPNSGWAKVVLETGSYTGEIHLNSSAGMNMVAPGTGACGLQNNSGSKGVYLSGTGNFEIYGGGIKNFSIDHPLDPDKTLVHVCVESDKAGLTYDGRSQLSGGVKEIQMPDWFEPLTEGGRFSVIVTPVGKFAPLYVVENQDGSIVKNGKFAVKCDDPSCADVKFCWVLNAERFDHLDFNPVREGKSNPFIGEQDSQPSEEE